LDREWKGRNSKVIKQSDNYTPDHFQNKSQCTKYAFSFCIGWEKSNFGWAFDCALDIYTYYFEYLHKIYRVKL